MSESTTLYDYDKLYKPDASGITVDHQIEHRYFRGRIDRCRYEAILDTSRLAWYIAGTNIRKERKGRLLKWLEAKTGMGGSV